MRRILPLLLVVVLGAALVAPACHAASSSEPENSFCIYGVSGMDVYVRAKKGNMAVGAHSINYSFSDGSSHFDNPYVISNSKISEWYNFGITSIEINCSNASAITLRSPDAIISGTSTITISGDGTPLSLTTKLLALKRMYLFPVGSSPNIAGVTPTPFVNNGSDIVVDDEELKNTIGAVDSFQPFMQFIFKSVIPWAGFAAVIILVFATIKFMLRG